MPEFLSVGMTKTVTDQTADRQGYWFRPTNVGQLDEIMNDSSFYSYITNPDGATLEATSDGLRVSSTALGLGLVGGGSELIKYSHAAIATGVAHDGDTIALGKANGDVVKVAYLADSSVKLSALAQDAIDYIDSSGGGGTGGVPNDNSVSTVKIQDGAVTFNKLNADAISYIDSKDVRVPDDSSVTMGKLASDVVSYIDSKDVRVPDDSSVTMDKLAADVVSYIDSKDVRVPEDSSVTMGKLAADVVSYIDSKDVRVPDDNSVTTAKIVNNAVTLAKLNSDVISYIDSSGGGGGYEGFYDLGLESGNFSVPFNVYKYNRVELSADGKPQPTVTQPGCYKLMVKSNGYVVDWSDFDLQFDPTLSDLDWTLVDVYYSPDNEWSLS